MSKGTFQAAYGMDAAAKLVKKRKKKKGAFQFTGIEKPEDKDDSEESEEEKAKKQMKFAEKQAKRAKGEVEL